MINSYFFMEMLSELLREGDIIVVGAGTAFTGGHQTMRLKKGQRFIANVGCGAMGYGLPAAIGACIGSGKPVVLIEGDGGMQMNIQELATIMHHHLPIKMFVLNNRGYLAIRITQRTYFGRYGGLDKGTGLSFPDFKKIATAYGIAYRKANIKKRMAEDIRWVLKKKGPVLCDIMMPPEQSLYMTAAKSILKIK